MRFCLLIVILYASSLCGQSDFGIVQHYTRKDGLTNSAIYCIYEDSRGFLWIATKEGLNRFDGLHFRTYYHNKHEPNSLPHNTVYDILEYQPGLLLVATANGLAVYNTSLGKFENERIQHSAVAAGSGVKVTSLHKDDDGNIWVNGNGELDVFDEQLQFKYRFTDMDWAQSLKGSLITYEDWQTDAQGRIWLPTDTSGIQIIDFVHKTIYNREHNPGKLPYMKFNAIRAMLLDKERNVLYLSAWGGGIYRYDLNTGNMISEDFEQPLQEASSINSIVGLDNGKLLFNSNGKFFEADPVTLQYHQIEFPFYHHAENKNEIIHPITIVRSSDQRYWIGANEGLYQLEKDNLYHEITIVSSTEESECLNVMVASSGTIYGLYENGKLIETDSRGTTYAAYPIPGQPGDFLIELCEDNQQRIWIASSHGVILFDMVSKKFMPPASSIGQLHSLFINTLYHDPSGEMWIGTRQPFGLYKYTFRDQKLDKIEDEAVTQMGMVSGYARISSITKDHLGNLWMRSVVGGGILQFNKKNKSWKRYPPEDGNVNLLENKGIYALHPDGDGNLWLCTTIGDGLIRYQYQTNEIEQYNREDGVMSDLIFDIGAYKDQLWLSTEYGYTKFNTRDHTLISEDWPQPLESFEMAMDTHANMMVIATGEKILFIPAKENKTNTSAPVPVIDAISVNHKEQYIDPRNTKLQLKYDQKNITIDFTAAYFTEVDKLKFAYFLQGADHDWQFPRDTRRAQYATLRPGTYVFKLKVSDPQGNWGDPVDAFKFTIVPPFWQTAWFVAMLGVAVATIIFLIIRKRIRTVRYESSLKQKVAETEMMALRAQMNPHFIFNSLNSIDALIHNDDKYQATLYLNKFAKLIRNILDSSKQNKVTVEKDMETLRLYIELEQFRSENAFKSDIQIDPAVLKEDIRVPPLIIQPYVENAILHGLRNRSDDNGELHISIQRTPDGLAYVIQDNGVGRKFTMNGRRHEKVSYGMQMSSDRIMIFNQEEKPSVKITDLYDDDTPAGTKVEIRLKTT